MDARETTPCPKTPSRPIPNSSRKMFYTPTLFRPTASPSHSAKMSTLFKDAALGLRDDRTASRCSPSNIKRPRMPSSQTRFTRFGSAPGGQHNSTAGNAARGDGSDSGLTFRHNEEGSDTLHHPPIRGRPTSPLAFHLPMNNDGIYRAPADPVAAILAGDDHSQACEPISSGFATPVAVRIPICETPIPKGARPKESCGTTPSAHRSQSDDEEHSTHGVRLVLPYTYAEAEEAQRVSIDHWLEQVLGTNCGKTDPSPRSCKDKLDTRIQQEAASTNQSTQTGPSTDSDLSFACEGRESSCHSSNKENIPPPLPPRIAPPPYISSPATPLNKWTGDNTPATVSGVTHDSKRFPNALLPINHLSAPPRRRKKSRINSDDVHNTPSQISERIPSHDYTVHEDDLSAALATLSPSVQRYRKGRCSPKRTRCASFWDTDILAPGSPAYPMDEAACER